MSQTSYTTEPTVGIAGALCDAGNHDIVSKSIAGIDQVSTVTVVTAEVANSTDYVVYINSVPCTYTSDATATQTEINVGLIAAINDHAQNSATGAFNVTAAQGATVETVVITGDEEGETFTITVTATILTVATGTKAAGAIAYGLAVAQGSSDGYCRPVQASADVILGIAVKSDSAYHVTTNGAYEIGDQVNILTKGRIWVTAEDGVSPGDAVYVRYAAGTYSTLGAFRSDADSSSAVALSGAKFMTTATAGNLVQVAINLPA